MIAAALTALAATTCMQAGYFLWKLCGMRQPRFGTVPHAAFAWSLLRDWRWLAGLAATVAGWLLFVRATALGDISLVQPLMTFGDVVLVLLAVVVLHERLAATEWIGVATTVLGAGLLAADATHSPAAASVFDAALLSMLVAAAALSGAALLWAARRRARPEIALALTIGLAFGCGAALTKALTGDGTELGWRVLADPLLYAVVASNVFGLALLQIAFQRGRAAVIVPVQLATTSCIAVAAGVLAFGETMGTLRSGGIVLVLAGAAMLNRG